MLPSADAASIAFAEVSSFVQYLIETTGRPSFMLLFADLKGMGPDSASAALASVTGYDLTAWIQRWHAHLLDDLGHAPAAAPAAANDDALRALTEHSMAVGARDRARLNRPAHRSFVAPAARDCESPTDRSASRCSCRTR